MKMRLILAFTAIMMVANAALAQSPTKDQVNKLLVKKWKTDYATMEGEKYEMTADEEIMISFQKDGKGSMSSDGETLAFTWTYDAETGSLTISYTEDDEQIEETGELTKLNANEFVWSMEDDESGGTVDLHFIVQK